LGDVQLTAIIISVFVIVGGLLPLIEAEFTTDVSSNDIDNLEDEISDSAQSNAFLTGFAVVGSIAQMFFWTFGALPFWLDLIFTIFRIMLIVLLIRLARGVSG